MNLKTICVTLSVLISSCAVNPPDIFVCADLDQSTGYCAKTISDEQKEVTGEEWQDFKSTSLKMSASDWSQLKAYILKMCEKNKQCKQQDLTQRLTQLESTLLR